MKLVMQTAAEPNALLVAAAHFLELLPVVGKEDQSYSLRMTREIYAPLLAALGQSKTAQMLRDESLRYQNPAEYAHLIREINKSAHSSTLDSAEAHLENIQAQLVEYLEKHGFILGRDYQPYARFKGVYSIHKKLANHEITADEIKDLYGIMFVLNDERAADIWDLNTAISLFWAETHGGHPTTITTKEKDDFKSHHIHAEDNEGRHYSIMTLTESDYLGYHYGEQAAHWVYDAHKEPSLKNQRYTPLLADPSGYFHTDFQKALELARHDTVVLVHKPTGKYGPSFIPTLLVPEGSLIDLASDPHIDIPLDRFSGFETIRVSQVNGQITIPKTGRPIGLEDIVQTGWIVRPAPYKPGNRPVPGREKSVRGKLKVWMTRNAATPDRLKARSTISETHLAHILPIHSWVGFEAFFHESLAVAFGLRDYDELLLALSGSMDELVPAILTLAQERGNQLLRDARLPLSVEDKEELLIAFPQMRRASHSSAISLEHLIGLGQITIAEVKHFIKFGTLNTHLLAPIKDGRITLNIHCFERPGVIRAVMKALGHYPGLQIESIRQIPKENNAATLQLTLTGIQSNEVEPLRQRIQLIRNFPLSAQHHILAQAASPKPITVKTANTPQGFLDVLESLAETEPHASIQSITCGSQGLFLQLHPLPEGRIEKTLISEFYRNLRERQRTRSYISLVGFLPSILLSWLNRVWVRWSSQEVKEQMLQELHGRIQQQNIAFKLSDIQLALMGQEPVQVRWTTWIPGFFAYLHGTTIYLSPVLIWGLRNRLTAPIAISILHSIIAHEKAHLRGHEEIGATYMGLMNFVRRVFRPQFVAAKNRQERTSDHEASVRLTFTNKIMSFGTYEVRVDVETPQPGILARIVEETCAAGWKIIRGSRAVMSEAGAHIVLIIRRQNVFSTWFITLLASMYRIYRQRFLKDGYVAGRFSMTELMSRLNQIHITRQPTATENRRRVILHAEIPAKKNTLAHLLDHLADMDVIIERWNHEPSPHTHSIRERHTFVVSLPPDTDGSLARIRNFKQDLIARDSMGNKPTIFSDYNKDFQLISADMREPTAKAIQKRLEEELMKPELEVLRQELRTYFPDFGKNLTVLSEDEAANADENTLSDFDKTIGLAYRYHEGDVRKRSIGNYPYAGHPLAVAYILLVKFKVRNPLTLQTAILHDGLEDGPANLAKALNISIEQARELILRQIRETFPYYHQPLIDNLTFVDKNEEVGNVTELIERDFLELLLIKIADHMHNIVSCFDVKKKNGEKGWDYEFPAKSIAKDVRFILGAIQRIGESHHFATEDNRVRVGIYTSGIQDYLRVLMTQAWRFATIGTYYNRNKDGALPSGTNMEAINLSTHKSMTAFVQWINNSGSTYLPQETLTQHFGERNAELVIQHFMGLLKDLSQKIQSRPGDPWDTYMDESLKAAPAEEMNRTPRWSGTRTAEHRSVPLQPDGLQRPSRALPTRAAHNELVFPNELHEKLAERLPSFADWAHLACHSSHRTLQTSFHGILGKTLAATILKTWEDLIESKQILRTQPFFVTEITSQPGSSLLEAAHPYIQTALLSTTLLWMKNHLHLRVITPSHSQSQHTIFVNPSIQHTTDSNPFEPSSLKSHFSVNAGIVIDNRALDTQDIHKILIHPDGRIDVALLVISIPRHALSIHTLSSKLRNQLQGSDAYMRQTFGLRNSGVYYLDRETVQAIVHEQQTHTELDRLSLFETFVYEETYVDATCIPKVAGYCAWHHTEIAQAVSPMHDRSSILYIDLASDALHANMADILSKGFLLTIESGDLLPELLQRSRQRKSPFITGTLPEEEVVSPYEKTSRTPWTTLHDFTSILHTGAAMGLTPVRYGTASVWGLEGEDLEAFPPSLRFLMQSKNLSTPSKRPDDISALRLTQQAAELDVLIRAHYTQRYLPNLLGRTHTTARPHVGTFYVQPVQGHGAAVDQKTNELAHGFLAHLIAAVSATHQTAVDVSSAMEALLSGDLLLNEVLSLLGLAAHSEDAAHTIPFIMAMHPNRTAFPALWDRLLHQNGHGPLGLIVSTKDRGQLVLLPKWTFDRLDADQQNAVRLFEAVKAALRASTGEGNPHWQTILATGGYLSFNRTVESIRQKISEMWVSSSQERSRSAQLRRSA